MKWDRLAAKQGHAGAQLTLGSKYELGKGVEQDYKEAVKWYRLAAEQGDANAQQRLGIMYYLGQGVSQDVNEATKWLHLAADQGDERAKKALGRIDAIKDEKSLSCIFESPENLAGSEIQYTFNESSNTLWVNRGGKPENIRISNMEIAYRINNSDGTFLDVSISRNTGRFSMTDHGSSVFIFGTGTCQAVTHQKF